MLIWGASSSVGSVAIQLARAAGYKVFATASRRNFDFAKELGASEVFDYTDSEVVEKIKDRLKGAKLAGVYDSIGEEGTTRACAEVLSNAGGGVLPTVLWPPSDLPENVKPELSMYRFLSTALLRKLTTISLGHQPWRGGRLRCCGRMDVICACGFGRW